MTPADAVLGASLRGGVDVSARETHVTEFGLGLCAGLSMQEGERAGMRFMTVACGAPFYGDSHVVVAPTTVPTCPRCAVMRDEALEGRLPKRKENES